MKTALPPPVEICRIRRCGPTFGFASVRLPGVMLNGLRIRREHGEFSITAPSTADKNGVPWPCYSIQPGTREAVLAAIAQVWAASEAGRP